MPNPNPEEFARQVLWHLCGIQAHLYQVEQHLIVDLSLRTDDPDKMAGDLRAKWTSGRADIQRTLYAKAAQRAGLSEQAQKPPPPDEPPAFAPPFPRV